jgi:hypothetical protein
VFVLLFNHLPIQNSMKRIIAFSLICFLIISCSPTKPSMQQEDEMFITRKYVGDFIEYRYTQPEKLSDPHLIWIKTTLESIYGKIVAFSKTCQFRPGERLYVRRTYSNRGGVWGDWTYQIESDTDNISYRLSQFQSGNKIMVQSWF